MGFRTLVCDAVHTLPRAKRGRLLGRQIREQSAISFSCRSGQVPSFLRSLHGPARTRRPKRQDRSGLTPRGASSPLFDEIQDKSRQLTEASERKSPTPELRIPNAAAQTRIVSKARIRLDSWKSVRSFKEIISVDISEFESSHPSHAVTSLWAMSGLRELLDAGGARGCECFVAAMTAPAFNEITARAVRADNSGVSAASDCVASSHAPGDKARPASSALCRAHRCGPSC
jgi:hypothetical protein